MKSCLANDVLKVLNLLRDMTEETKADCENNMEKAFGGMMDTNPSLEGALECVAATIDIEGRNFLQAKLTDAIKETTDRYLPNVKVEGA